MQYVMSTEIPTVEEAKKGIEDLRKGGQPAKLPSVQTPISDGIS